MVCFDTERNTSLWRLLSEEIPKWINVEIGWVPKIDQFLKESFIVKNHILCVIKIFQKIFPEFFVIHGTISIRISVFDFRFGLNFGNPTKFLD